ncbi:P-loop containing nucleoside triphosphate hydrolase protein [Myxozyma melibiosi]|uniref:DNA helicase n=1 Tax=Myxozyma melibiosi TaxID=54550 RepID=A0ABR1F7Q1_9ASCO
MESDKAKKPPASANGFGESEVIAKLTKKFKTALKKEREEDVARTQQQIQSLPPKILARRGLAILNVSVSSVRTALGGATVLELEPDLSTATTEIEKNSIKTGDIVAVEKVPSATEKKSKTSSGSRVEGVVLRQSPKQVLISVDDKYSEAVLTLEGRLWIVKLADAVTYARMDETMEDLSKLTSPTRLQRIVIGTTKPTKPKQNDEPIQYLDDTLNGSQKKAVAFSLGESEVSIVHGPPGTGKTYTVIEIIRQLVAKGQRVLVCGPSNISVDTILERLHGLLPPDNLLRIGHPARLLTSTQQHSLDLILRTSEPGQIVRDIRTEIDESFAKIKKTRSGREKTQIFRDIKDLRKEYRARERKALNEVLNQGRVVVCTLHGAGSKFLSGIEFNTIIIDEVSQSLESQCWIPILNHPEAEKLIISGDNKQLPPTIKSVGNEKVLGVTLFDRLVATHGDSIRNLLNVQYRMNDTIMQYPSLAMYEGKLLADDSVRDRTLADLEYVTKCEETEAKVLWIDTQGGEFGESVSEETAKFDPDGGSKSNDLEAWLVVQEVSDLLDRGVKVSDIGVISPYNAQVSLIAKRVETFLENRNIGLSEKEENVLEVSSVDGFQGREKNAIIISMVRSNDKGEVGFLKEDRRLNVAITRPRRYLSIIGDSETLSRGSNFLKGWADWAMDNAEIRYPDVGEVLEFAMRAS